MSIIENRTFEELRMGDSASLSHTLDESDIRLFAIISGDVNPAHVDVEYARDSMFHKPIAHGMWGGALISAVLGTLLPGPGTIYLGQSLRFLRPVGPGDTVIASVTVIGMDTATSRVKLDCRVTNQHQVQVITGVAEVLAPKEKIARLRVELPKVEFHEKRRRQYGRDSAEAADVAFTAQERRRSPFAGKIEIQSRHDGHFGRNEPNRDDRPTGPTSPIHQTDVARNYPLLSDPSYFSLCAIAPVIFGFCLGSAVAHAGTNMLASLHAFPSS